MRIDELEAAVLKLAPRVRARLAERLLDSLEQLSDKENEQVWAEEAEQRDAAWESSGASNRPADDVFRDASARLRE